MRNALLALATVAIVATGAFLYHRANPIVPPQILQQPVARGDVLETVIATGTVSADRAVSVGTEVNGNILKLYVDFNSIVHKGELLAEIDPAPIQAQLDSVRAMLDQAKLAETQEEAQLGVDELNASRAETLYAQSLLDDQDREEAAREVALDKAQIVQDKAAIDVAQAAVTGSETDLAHCRISSPIDGVVIERDVDVGQTVVSRVSAPTLFVLGTDLRHLRVVGDVDESEIAKIHAGQPVRLMVDAYPTIRFPAAVTSTRLNATNAANVVTYQVVADVDNAALELRPGMTATMTFEIWRASGVLRVPTPALRFRPTVDMFALLHQSPVVESRPALPDAARGSAPQATVTTAITSETVARASMTNAASATAARSAAETGLVDALFQPPQPPETSARVWVLRNGKLETVPVRVGITDGRWTALLDGNLMEGEELVTNVLK